MSATIDPTRPVPAAEFTESYDATLVVTGQDVHLDDAGRGELDVRSVRRGHSGVEVAERDVGETRVRELQL